MQATRLRWWVSGAKFAMFVSSEIGTAATSTVLADQYTGVAVLLVAVSFFVSYVPARRARLGWGPITKPLRMG